MNSVTLKANAKINLTLAVKYRRPDGYHEIESIFQEVEFADNIELTLAAKIGFKTNSSVVPTDQTNLCVQAAELICSKYNLPGVNIQLTKHIPVGAGLGGGSSDAAAVLKGIASLYNLNCDNDALMDLAAQIGSDVPFFISGGSAYVTGRGEVLTPIRMKCNYRVLLLFPGLTISTAWAYKNLNLALTKKDSVDKLIGFKFQDLNAAEFESEYYNDFENTVFKSYPELAEIKKKLYRNGACYAAMSGSGSTMFALFEQHNTAREAADILSDNYTCHLVKPVC